MNPWPILLAIILFAAGAAGGWKAANDHRDALELADARGKAEALEATAKEIAKVKIVHQTITNQLETQIKEKTFYETCKNDPAVVKTINEALRGGVSK